MGYCYLLESVLREVTLRELFQGSDGSRNKGVLLWDSKESLGRTAHSC